MLIFCYHLACTWPATDLCYLSPLFNSYHIRGRQPRLIEPKDYHNIWPSKFKNFWSLAIVMHLFLHRLIQQVFVNLTDGNELSVYYFQTFLSQVRGAQITKYSQQYI